MSLFSFLSSGSELENMRKAADIVSKVLLELEKMTAPGVSLDMLDELAERLIREAGAIPFNKGYHPKWAEIPYPATVCFALNEEICHAPPHNRTLKDGDIITYDLGIKYKGVCGDAALTVPVGEHVSNRRLRALRYAKEGLYRGIEVVRAGAPVSAIGRAIEDYVSKMGFRVIKDFGGHAIGKEMHMKPFIPHYYDKANDNILLEEGQIICVEPMITPGKAIVGMMGDKWTAFCIDDQVCAMFEHMILVKKDGFEILTSHIAESHG